jgi:hypothetical protein
MQGVEDFSSPPALKTPTGLFVTIGVQIKSFVGRQYGAIPLSKLPFALAKIIILANKAI